ncbi:hypothetical protein CHS0354_030156 [Potamilus streckersoni]|uniref:Myb-like domain-containing protein n=1 Tax=Potamilus streckersoni TaxID=2493646 RepID=A0AAE0STZ9_9BIVA|nr:hypothetical protein CHS0354_030156 [Potamilus streckersoni]
MASRRARLYIKPNLSPKDPTTQANESISSLVKVVTDDLSTPIGNEKQNTQETPDDSPQQISNESEKITTSSDRNEHKETHTPEDVPEGCVDETRSLEAGVEYTPPLVDCSVSSTEETNCLISESKNESATDQIKDNNEHSKIENSKTDTNDTGVVVCARFRRFGKVNIPSLKSNVQDSKTFENTNDQIPVDTNIKNSGRPVISSSVQVSPLSVPQSNVTEVFNKIVDQVDANDTQKEIAETFVIEPVKVTSESQLQNTEVVNSSKIGDEEVVVQSNQLDLSQENVTENLTKIIDKSVSEIVLEKPNDVRQEPESKILAGGTMQEFTKVNVVNAKPRIRLPKVKPNLADALRRPNKNIVAEETAEPREESVQEARNIVAEETAEPREESVQEASTKLSSAEEKEKEPIPSSQSQTMTPTSVTLQLMSQTMTPSPVPLQLMSPVNRSPTKHWTSMLNQSPVKNSVDKRSRTVSISESPPKKKKQLVIVAPTDQLPDRTKMRMKDMIYWNPSSNPMKSKEKATPYVKDKENKKENKVAKSVEEEIEEEEEGVEEALMDEDSNGSNALPVPQVTVGPDGSIIINEQSLIVDQKDELPREELEVIDETDVFTTYHSYRKQNRSRSWSAKETNKFYKALGLVGIDFFLIGKLFPTRKHFELKKKFLKEERTNKLLIDQVLKEGGRFNMAVFKQLDADDKEDEKQKNQNKEKKETSNERKRKKEPEKQKEENKSKRKTQTKKNRSKNINYFEDSDSEIEEARTARNKSQNRATNISNVDGELLEILMTMREGRIHSSDKETRVSPQPKVIVEPNQGPSTTFFMNSNQVNMPNQNDSQQGQNLTNTSYNSNSQSETNQFRFVTISPETGEQITLEPKPQTPDQETCLVNSANTIEGEGVTAGNSGQGIAQQETADSIGTASQGLPQIVASSQPGSGPNIQLPLEMFNVQNGEDQFVLVTVLPENGEPGETVIHVYRLQGGNNVPQIPIQNL